MKRRLPGIVVVLAASSIIFAAVPGEFLSTDVAEIVDRLLVSDSGSQLAAAIVNGREDVSYRPTIFLLHSVNYWLTGESALAFRAVNAALHVGTAALLYLLLRRMRAGRDTSVWTASLFAVFPLVATSVAWAGARTDIVALGGCLAFFVLSHEALQRGRRWALAAGWLCLLLAVGAKEVVTGSLLVSVAFVMTRPREERARYTAFLIAHATAIGAYWPMRWRVAGESSMVPRPELTVFDRLEIAAHVQLGYLKELALPHTLRVCDSLDGKPAPFELVLFGAVLAAVAIAAVSCFRARKHLIFLALIWVVAFSLTTSGIVPLRHVRADRYLYCLLPALSFLSVTAARSLPRRFGRAGASPWLLAGLYVYFVLGLLGRASHLRDDQKLWSYEVARDPACREGYAHLARRAFISRRYTEARDLASAALAPMTAPNTAFVPRDVTRLYRGMAHMMLGASKAARADLEAVLGYGTRRARAEAAYELALMQLKQEDARAAVPLLARALAEGLSERAGADAWLLRAYAEAKLGWTERARQSLSHYRAPAVQPAWHAKLLDAVEQRSLSGAP